MTSVHGKTYIMFGSLAIVAARKIYRTVIRYLTYSTYR